MEILTIKETEITPKVLLNHNDHILEISGESRPEDVRKFYLPILDWLEKYDAYLFWLMDKYPETKKKKIPFSFNFEYFNSTSAKYILDILNKLDKLHANGFNIVVYWHHEKLDEDILKAGKSFEEMTSVPFEFVVV